MFRRRHICGHGGHGSELEYLRTRRTPFGIRIFSHSHCGVRTDILVILRQQEAKGILNTDRRRLTTGIRSEKCVVRRFHRCANVYLHKTRQYSIAYYTPRLYTVYSS
jgi:hypothetical protein